MIYRNAGKPSITLATRERDRGIITFPSENTPSQITWATLQQVTLTTGTISVHGA